MDRVRKTVDEKQIKGTTVLKVVVVYGEMKV